MSTPPDPDSAEAASEQSYSDAMSELTEIVAELEGEAVDVDRLAEQVERASVLVRSCRSRLDLARSKVTDIIDDLDQLDTGAAGVNK